jgi:nitrate reductase NapD
MGISRRDLLRGTTAPVEGAHISSLVVHCRPDVLDSVIDRIEAMPEAEVPRHSEEGKLVVLLETADEGRIMQRISAIEQLPGVINAALVYHEIDFDSGDTP